MSGFVLDSSTAVSWFFEDEAKSKTIPLMARVRDHGARVPALWHWEIANVFGMAERKGRITQAESTEALGLLVSLPIEIDDGSVRTAFYETLQLARTHRLTTYDASYLELALRLNLELATLDGQLRQAAGRCGVALA